MKTISILMLAFGAIGFSSADTVLYAPNRSIADQQITVHAWGSGTAGESDETAFEGTTSIRVSPKNLFSGGEIYFGATPDLSKEYSDKNDLLRITFKAAEASAALGAGGPGPGKGKAGAPPGLGGPGGPAGAGGNKAGAGGGQGGNKTGAGGPGGFGGSQFGPAGPGAPGGKGKASTPATTELKLLRLVITTTDNLKSEAYVPADLKPDANGWRQIGVPLQVISGFGGTNKIIKEISFSTDKTTTIWIGDLRTIVDTTPITGESNQGDLNLAEGDEVTLSANGYGGASMLKYEWYFDNDTSGIPDAVGQAILHKFRKPDTYTITLVISDYFGLKQPYKTTFTAKVN
jgi:hypothetical protein